MNRTIFLSPQQKKVYDLVATASQDGSEIRVSEIATAIGIKQPNASYLMGRLVRLGAILRVGHGKYKIADGNNIIEHSGRPYCKGNVTDFKFGRAALTESRLLFLNAWQDYERSHGSSPSLSKIGSIIGITRERARQLSSYLIKNGYLEIRTASTEVSERDLVVLDAFDSMCSDENQAIVIDNLLCALPSFSKSDVANSLLKMCKMGYFVRYRSKYYQRTNVEKCNG